MTDKEVMQMALDAMVSFSTGTNGLYEGEFAEEIAALRTALSQPEQEPVAWKYETPAYVSLQWKQRGDWRDGTWTALYTVPLQRPWQGLTDEEVESAFMANTCCDDLVVYEHIARAIEAKLKEKNNR